MYVCMYACMYVEYVLHNVWCEPHRRAILDNWVAINSDHHDAPMALVDSQLVAC